MPNTPQLHPLNFYIFSAKAIPTCDLHAGFLRKMFGACITARKKSEHTRKHAHLSYSVWSFDTLESFEPHILARNFEHCALFQVAYYIYCVWKSTFMLFLAMIAYFRRLFNKAEWSNFCTKIWYLIDFKVSKNHTLMFNQHLQLQKKLYFANCFKISQRIKKQGHLFLFASAWFQNIPFLLDADIARNLLRLACWVSKIMTYDLYIIQNRI